MRKLCIFGLALGLATGCGSTPPTAVKTARVKSFCPAKTQQRTAVLVGQKHRWCERRDGVLHGPYRAHYDGGRKRLSFTLKHGRVHGAYAAWHKSGRWAIKVKYRQGRPVGQAQYRPPHGLPTTCPVAECGAKDSILDRPFCLPNEISTVFSAARPGLMACLKSVTEQPDGEATARWKIDLMGRPKAVRLQMDSEVPPEVLGCLTRAVEALRFPAPMGEVCRVSMGFKLGYR